MKRVRARLLVMVAGLGIGLSAHSADVTIHVQTRMDPPRWAVLERQLLTANVPASCAADDLGQGLLNASAVFAPSAPTSGGKTYYFVIFSSARSYGDEFAEPFQLPRDGSAPDGLRNSSQLYLATIVVDNESGLMRSFPAIYLWNQNRAAGSSGASRLHRSNFWPSWSNAQLPPLTIPPVTND